jgi:hypothetical protein
MGLVRLCLALAVAFSLAFPAASQDWSYGNGFYASCSEVVAPPRQKARAHRCAVMGSCLGIISLPTVNAGPEVPSLGWPEKV